MAADVAVNLSVYVAADVAVAVSAVDGTPSETKLSLHSLLELLIPYVPP